MSDKRFARVANDPRFKRVDRKRRKVKIDSRFERMFNDKTFTTKHFVDKRGAIIGKTSKEDLQQFYDLSDDDKEESQANKLRDSKKKLISKTKKQGPKLGKKTRTKKGQLSSLNTSLEEDIDNNKKISNTDFQNQRTMESSDDEDETSGEDEESGNKAAVDLARGEGNIASSSSDDEDDDEDGNDIHKAESSNYKQDALQDNVDKSHSYDTDTDDEDDFQDDELEHQWAELDSNIHRSSNVTSRLAVCNLDWDKITATDLFVLFSSIKGVVKSVKIYPSEYGLERLKNEECYGPEELREQEDVIDDNNVEGSSFSREKLRQYQINRLKYYYAVVECDSAETSNHVYEEFDGAEFELSGNLMDLRFIPDDMEFEHEPTSVATEMPTLATYKPPEFETTALHQTNVKLTWDETDSNRLKATMKSFSKDDIQEMDFQAYLASSDDEGEEFPGVVGDEDEDSHSEDEEEKIAKYKKLVQEIDSKEHEDDHDNEMEITWEPGLKESALDLVAKKRAEKEEKNLTAWEKYLNNKKEKRKERRKKELLKNEVSQEEDEDDTPEGVDMSDPFFNQDFGPDFPINNNERVKTKAGAKRKRKKQTTETEEDKKRKEELELLLMDGKEEPQHFSLKGILENEKKKKKRKKRRKEQQTAEDHFKVNVEDPRFSALFSSHLYAIDPSDPQFKKTKAMDTIFDERQRRRQEKKQVTEELTQNNKASKYTEGEKTNIDPSLSLLVKSVKSKTGEFNQRRKKQKTV
ncbi:ESF1 homolog [Actinia tenebrosa]|uniref:ESF1 homolog n=1 Tax=Actinia tenebrosa TaxID=6105 RepID=A0A6P8I432_ACTTE|nr:ESF1 homolog [Actinia tenebrosa]